MSGEISPIGGPGGHDAIKPVPRAPDAGDATAKQRDPQTGEGPKKKEDRRKLAEDGSVDLIKDDGEIVKTTVGEWRAKYREVFGEEPPDTLIDIQA